MTLPRLLIDSPIHTAVFEHLNEQNIRTCEQTTEHLKLQLRSIDVPVFHMLRVIDRSHKFNRKIDRWEAREMSGCVTFEPGLHGILFYRDLAHKREVLFSFLRNGLEQGKGVVYVAGVESPQMICRALVDSGFDTESLEKEGCLKVLSYDGWYVVDGKVRPASIAALWRKAFEEALERGLRGLHVCGEMSCFFKHGLVEELLEYEKSCERRFSSPVSALCAYSLGDLKFLEPESLLEVVNSHSHVFSPRFAGQFDFDRYSRLLMPEKLKALYGAAYAEEVISFLRRWKQILDEDLGEDPEDLHTTLRSLIGPRVGQVRDRILRDMYLDFGLEMTYSG